MGFATAPPYTPLCKSLLGPVTSTSIYAKPLKPASILGVSLAMIDVSEIKIISPFSFSLFAIIHGPKLAEPTSSSPSIINFTLQGKVFVFIMVSKAFTCMYICPLSSQLPRAKIAPSG